MNSPQFPGFPRLLSIALLCVCALHRATACDKSLHLLAHREIALKTVAKLGWLGMILVSAIYALLMRSRTRN